MSEGVAVGVLIRGAVGGCVACIRLRIQVSMESVCPALRCPGLDLDGSIDHIVID